MMEANLTTRTNGAMCPGVKWNSQRLVLALTMDSPILFGVFFPIYFLSANFPEIDPKIVKIQVIITMD